MTDTLQQRAAELYDQGRRTAYAIGYATITDPSRATHLHICLGEQWSGKRLYMVDLDSHTPEQNADAAKAAFEAERPELTARLDWHRSKSNTGWHAYFESSVQIPTGKLYDQAGQHIGELLGTDSDRTLDPGDVRIPCLHVGEIERLLNVWHVKGSDPKGEQWKDRAKQGAAWARGSTRMPVTKDELRAHLKRNCGWRGAAADALFDQREAFDRSAAFGRLLQTLMLHAHRIPGQQNTGFLDKCKAVMAYAIASDAYGKAGEEGYTFEKDAASLIAQIVNEDPYGAGLQWTAPFWAKGNATSAPAPLPAPEAPRPAHRPAGDRSRHLVTFRRVLESIEPDAFGRRSYTLASLADKMKIARCAVAPRTIQSYLQTLRKADEIATAQIGGNGIPYAVLTRCFGGADNYQKRVETAVESPAIGGADPIADERIETPQSVETPPVCIVDHQNTSAPVALPAPPFVPAVDEWAGIDQELDVWERTTAEGRHFAKLRRQQEATAESVTQLCGVLRPAQRDLVSQVRKAARRANEPDWWQRDYAAMDTYALTVELRRLQAPAGDSVGAHSAGVPLSSPGVQSAFI